MRTALLSITGAGFLLLAGAAPSFSSDVSCGIVMKSVKMGRSTQDIADTMMVSTADIEKCKALAAAAAAAAPKEGYPAGGKPADMKPQAEGAAN